MDLYHLENVLQLLFDIIAVPNEPIILKVIIKTANENKYTLPF